MEINIEETKMETAGNFGMISELPFALEAFSRNCKVKENVGCKADMYTKDEDCEGVYIVGDDSGYDSDNDNNEDASAEKITEEAIMFEYNMNQEITVDKVTITKKKVKAGKPRNNKDPSFNIQRAYEREEKYKV